MNFLQPWMLIGLPLIAVPIIIHLINQRRFQTVPWAAMMFLLSATKMSSGYSKLRQWLILLMRTLAIAALILFTARPLASGLLGLVAGQSNDLALVIVDRSPSMQESQPGTGINKLQAATTQLTETFRTLGVGRVVLCDSGSERPVEFENLNDWSRHLISGNSLTSDIPGMLEKALAYIKSNQSGTTNIWICSDLRESDWSARDGRWAALRDEFASLPQDIRIHVLDIANVSRDNLAIQVTSAKRATGADGPELLLSFKILRPIVSKPTGEDASDKTNSTRTNTNEGGSVDIPVEVQIGNARSALHVDMQGDLAEINDFRIPLEPAAPGSPEEEIGWGEVKLPGDANTADNTSYFTFQTPPVRKTIIVSDNPNIVASIELCAQIAPEQSIRCETETITASQLETVDLNAAALLVWHDQLPKDKQLDIITKFAASGGQVLLLPPESPNDTTAFGIQWKGWETLASSNSTADTATESAEANAESLARVQQWQNDSELLGNTLNGAPLPVGQLGVRRVCKIAGTVSALASLPDNVPLLMRCDMQREANTTTSTSLTNTTLSASPTDSPIGIYLCATTPSQRDSNLGMDGIVLYIAIQRVLTTGTERIGNARTVTVGQQTDDAMRSAVQLAGDTTVLSNQYAQNSGVYQLDSMLIAQNRRPTEDSAQVLDSDSLSKVFGELKWVRIGMESDGKSLVQEIWRWFVMLMLISLVVEAILCLPRSKIKSTQFARR